MHKNSPKARITAIIIRGRGTHRIDLPGQQLEDVTVCGLGRGRFDLFPRVCTHRGVALCPTESPLLLLRETSFARGLPINVDSLKLPLGGELILRVTCTVITGLFFHGFKLIVVGILFDQRVPLSSRLSGGSSSPLLVTVDQPTGALCGKDEKC